jgi:conjugative transposon TraM protein
MKSERKRKMLLVLPLLIIPFLTLAFWALGGGKGKADEKQSVISGLNLDLPNSKLKDDKMTDKLSFYDKADKDSMKMEEWMRSDPYYKEQLDTSLPIANELEELTQTTASKYNQKLNVSPYDKAEASADEKVLQKLSLLKRELSKNTDPEYKEVPVYDNDDKDPKLSGEVHRLENMMNAMNSGNGDDPEMKQLTGVMDKILDVQHPERVKERQRAKVAPKSIFNVTTISDDDTLAGGFFSLDNSKENKVGNVIEAVVNENQSLVNSAVIKLRLIRDIYINGNKIPAGNFINGIVSLNGERLEVEINSIRCGNDLYNVKMELYDMDGLPGIYIPGAIARDVAKQSADNSLQMMELTSLDPSFKAQAATTGLSAIKSLLSKKVKLVKVMVKAGYKVLLKDKSVQQ